LVDHVHPAARSAPAVEPSVAPIEVGFDDSPRDQACEPGPLDGRRAAAAYSGAPIRCNRGVGIRWP